jgi:uncharacterized protein YegP (UPF0339 family)
MSGTTIRTGSDVVPKPTQTDWARLKSLRDDEIDAAIAGDADAYALETEALGRSGSAYRYEVYQLAPSRFGWRLVSSEGRIFATSEGAFASKAEVRKAIAEVRAALLGGHLIAA